MNPSLLLWAKLGTKDYEHRHPVVCHLMDVAAVCLQLWKLVLRDASKRRLANSLALEPDVAGRWLAFWAGAHDIGKVAPCFQAKDRSGAARAALSAEGFDFPAGEDVPHGIISTRILAELLADPAGWPSVPAALARRIAVTVGGHHGVFPQTAEWDSLATGTLGNERWQQARRDILATLAAALRIVSLPAPTSPPGDHHAFFMFLAGLTSVADWIGSHKGLFPSAAGGVDLPAYFGSRTSMARRALDELGWTGWVPTSSEARTFAALFPTITQPRPLQADVERLAPTFTCPGLVLIEAPMGEGKTEAALFLADHWTHCTGQQGLYFALPTQATSNQMFDRVTHFLTERYPEDRVNLHLLHGQALLSDRYGELRRLADDRRQAMRLTDVRDDDKEPGGVVAEGWFSQNKKQGLLAPFAVGTIDQALLAVLQTKHVFVRLFGLAGKTVILDEVHAYDAYVSTLLERLLEWLAALGCSVVLLSATLPAGKRRRLLTAYSGRPVDPAPVAYPRVSVVTNSRVEVKPVEIDSGRRSYVALDWRDPGRLATDLGAALRDGGCAAVICNTVGRAQELYLLLREALRSQGCEVELFHARFPFGWRQKIEEGVLQRYGLPAGNSHRPQKAVLVATQVIEQSLDLDFDLMVTELAPVDLVLQRAGRMHRHRRDRRPVNLARPQLWLLEPEKDEEVPQFGKSEFVYARYVLLRSYLTLRGQKGVCLPDELETLVEAVYGESRLPAENPAWQAALADSLLRLQQDQKDDCKAADRFRIRSPAFEDDVLEDFCRQLEEDNPDVHPTHQAMTRLAEPTVTLVLLHERAGELFLNPDSTGRVNLGREPSLADAKRLLGNAVTISQRSCVRHFAALDPPAKWQKNSLLRFHRLARLDEGGKTPAGNFMLRLHPELGVVIDREGISGGIEP
jgi:CRISPR-associated endonuclease/helicase Cas3